MTTGNKAKKNWLVFTEQGYPEHRSRRRTQRWTVTNAENGSSLGEVRWYGAWRQYCFVVMTATAVEYIFSRGCLHELANFINDQMIAWRKSRPAWKRGRT